MLPAPPVACESAPKLISTSASETKTGCGIFLFPFIL
jgi:hypothetical protein